MEWAYGVTTCSSRLSTPLPRTLKSLAAAGFDHPRLFIDGHGDAPSGYDYTRHVPVINAYNNWILAVWELYARQPKAQRYALFQDDLAICHGVKEYLERSWPERGYLNLLTFCDNENRVFGKSRGWHLSNQLGKGALALVFDHYGMVDLLKSPHMVNKPQLLNGNQNIDGAVQHAMVVESKWQEYVHQPSLVQHLGVNTTIGQDYAGRLHSKRFPQSNTFLGESWDVNKEMPL